MKYRKDKHSSLEKKEKENSQEWAATRERAEVYRKMDDRQRDDEKRQNSERYRSYVEIESHNILREKINFNMFDIFSNRGKFPYIRFSYRRSKETRETCVEIRLNKRYAL